MSKLLALPSWAVVTPERAQHIQRVATLMREWAAARSLPEAERSRWYRAAILHDALKDADPATLDGYGGDYRDLPQKLWHGPAAAVMAARHGETDRGVLDAVRYHTVGFAGWDDVGRALYLADYLEPGRSGDRERAQFAARMPHEFDTVLREIAARRISWLLGKGVRIGRETWEFWNGLAEGDSSS